MKNNEFLLYTRCMTYNHAHYITDTMNGFCIQQTTFPFVCVIVDDASTDGEPEVIEKYLQENFNLEEKAVARHEETDDYRLVFAQHKSNKNCYFAVIFLKYNHYLKKDKYPYYAEWADNVKYIAWCEGDDYWTDPYKLQKQMEFLEKHPDFSMCCHGADVLNETERRVDCRCEYMTTREYLPDDAFPTWQIPTASIVYRREQVDGFKVKKFENFVAGDVVLILKCMHVGRVWGMAEHMSVYRMNPGGATSSAETIASRLKMCEHYKALMVNFPKINKDYCHRYIAMVHYTNFRHAKTMREKLSSLFTAFVNKPSYVFRKMLRIKARPRADLFYQYYGQ